MAPQDMHNVCCQRALLLLAIAQRLWSYGVMAYVSEIAVRIADKADWQAVRPGNDWEVVTNAANAPQDFNQGAGGKFVFVFYRPTLTGNPVSGLRLITGEKTPAPAGWTKLPQDLNAGSGGDFIFLAYTTTAGAPEIAKLTAGSGGSVGGAFESFALTDTVLRLDANKGANGKFVFLGFVYR
jgi:hypothetical protein